MTGLAITGTALLLALCALTCIESAWHYRRSFWLWARSWLSHIRCWLSGHVVTGWLRRSRSSSPTPPSLGRLRFTRTRYEGLRKDE